MGAVMDKHKHEFKFSKRQVITSTDIQRHYGKIKDKAKETPLVVTDNGNFDMVVLDYDFFESMYSRLIELEQAHEESILLERLDELEKHPERAVPWRSIRRDAPGE